MYTYSQGNHTLLRDGELLSSDGHAGNGAGMNNPAMQWVHNVGPLPRGFYKIGAWSTHPVLGPISAPLIPQPDASGSYAWLGGRGGFYIHGPVFSEGCVVQTEPIRLAMSLSGDSDLEVVA